jgi:hypothetical protein
MGNNKIVIIAVGAFVLFFVVMIFITFLFKKKTPQPVIDVTLSPTVSMPFDGRRFNGQDISPTKSPLTRNGFIQSLPVKTSNFQIEYNNTTDRINVIIPPNVNQVQAKAEFESYLQQEGIDINAKGMNIHYQTGDFSDVVSQVMEENNQQKTASSTSGSTQQNIDGLVEIFQKQKQTMLHTTNTPTPIAVAEPITQTPQTNKNSQSIVNDFLSIFNTQKSQTLNRAGGGNPTPTQEANAAQPGEPDSIQAKFLAIFSQVIDQIKPQPTPIPTPVVINTPAPTQNLSVNAHIFTDYGLPQPQAEGQYGYQNQLNRINSNPTIRWNVENLLNGEKKAIAKGINVKSYLTTGWIWFEVGPAGYPDIYEINCNDVSSLSDVTLRCATLGSGDLQIAGYQAGDRAGDYISMFNRLYPQDQLQSVMNSVIDNSTHASKNKWKYNSQNGILRYLVNNKVPSTLTLSDIASNKSQLGQEKTQLFTLILGKDPTMAIALNSYAVSDSDLIHCLKTKSSCYGYIDSQAKQRFSNIVAALILFDSGSLPK